MKTKDIILQKTFGLLLKRGYNGVSVSDIQEETGMARGLLYHYFGNQDLLFEQSVRSFFEKWVPKHEELENFPVTGLVAFLVRRYQQMQEEITENYMGEVSLTDVCLLWLDVAYRTTFFPEFFKQVGKERSMYWKMAVLNSFSRGELRNGLNLETVTRHFLYLEEGVILLSSAVQSSGDLIYHLEKTLLEYYEIVKR